MLTVLVVLIVSVTIFVVLLRAGKRLSPLTAERAKAAVPFGVLPSTRATAWTDIWPPPGGLSSLLGDYVTPVPAQQWLGPHWQAGSASSWSAEPITSTAWTRRR